MKLMDLGGGRSNRSGTKAAELISKSSEITIVYPDALIASTKKAADGSDAIIAFVKSQDQATKEVEKATNKAADGSDAIIASVESREEAIKETKTGEDQLQASTKSQYEAIKEAEKAAGERTLWPTK